MRQAQCSGVKNLFCHQTDCPHFKPHNFHITCTQNYCSLKNSLVECILVTQTKEDNNEN